MTKVHYDTGYTMKRQPACQPRNGHHLRSSRKPLEVTCMRCKRTKKFREHTISGFALDVYRIARSEPPGQRDKMEHIVEHTNKLLELLGK